RAHQRHRDVGGAGRAGQGARARPGGVEAPRCARPVGAGAARRDAHGRSPGERRCAPARNRSSVTRLAPLSCLVAALAVAHVEGWGPQGHRRVAMVATKPLAPAARQQGTAVLGEESLADVAVWADEYIQGNNQTSYWHYVNIPADAARYD